MKGVELFEALSDEQKELIVDKIGSRPFQDCGHLTDYTGELRSDWIIKYGAIRSSWIINESANSCRTRYYKMPNKEPGSFKNHKAWSFQTYKERKHVCTQEIYEIDSSGLLLTHGDVINVYQNDGKLISTGDKKYKYYNDTTVITYPIKHGGTIEKQFTLDDRILNLEEFKNGEPLPTGAKIKYNEDMKRSYATFTLGRYNSDIIKVSNVLYEYDEHKRTKEFEIIRFNILNGDTTYHVHDTTLFTYNKWGLLSFESDKKVENYRSCWYLIIESFYTSSNNGYYYNFFNDVDGLLNLYKLEYPSYWGPQKCKTYSLYF